MARLYLLAGSGCHGGWHSVLTISHKRGGTTGVGVVAGVGSIDGDFERANSIQRTLKTGTSGIGEVGISCRDKS